MAGNHGRIRLTVALVVALLAMFTLGVVSADAPSQVAAVEGDSLDQLVADINARDAHHTADHLRIAELEAELAAATATTTTTLAPTTTSSSSTTTSSTTTTSTSTTTTTTLPPSPSGQAMPVGDLPGWQYAMGEDFSTNVALGSWSPATTYRNTIGVYPSTYFDTSKCCRTTSGQYDPARVLSVQGGVLDKWLHTEGTRPKVGALIPVIPGVSQSSITDWTDQLYGRYSVRYRITNAMPGYKQAWLLWPESNDGRAQGEIDFPETDFNVTTGVSGFVHYINGVSGSDQYAMPRAAANLTAWHTMTIEWSPNLVRFVLDGLEVGRTTTRVANTPMHWVLQTETAVSSTTPAATVEGHLQIDWVAVWRYSP